MKYGLVGEKLGHSFSKEIHEKIENYTYTLCELTPDELDLFMKEKNFSAINVTIPYKEKVIPYLDFVSERAKSIGAVNTIVNQNGKLYGYNTDCLGLSALIRRADISLCGKKVIILGTGGTSKTASVVASELGAKEIVIVGRKPKDGCITYDKMYEKHFDADIIINTTPCGMYPDCENTPVNLSYFTSLSGVIDVIYNPLRSFLVSEAKSMGIKAEGGLYMLVSQAIYAIEKFVCRDYDEKVCDKIFSDIRKEKENIVLVGMPSSGKTTIAKELASRTRREMIDTDSLIVEKHNMPIPDIFATYGEEIFRDWETEAILEASKKSGVIISTGGGAVLRGKNVSYLKQNGTVYFIDRPLENLVPTCDRPLSQNKEAIINMYNTRYPIYTSVADFTITNDKSISEISAEIIYVHNMGGEKSE